MASEQGAVTGLSADYSDDELDAIALLLDRPLLAARRRALPRSSAERAVNEAALRALVARRALALEGTGERPRVRFLEPHRSLLDPFVGAAATIAVWVKRPDRVTATAYFLRGERAARQTALPGMAIKRMSLLSAAAVEADAVAALCLDDLTAGEGERATIELSPRMWGAAEAAAAEDDGAADAPSPAVDLLYARTATVELTVERSEGDGTRVRERLEWLAAGTLGSWSLEPGEGDPPATVRAQPVAPETLVERATSLLRAAVASSTARAGDVDQA